MPFQLKQETKLPFFHRCLCLCLCEVFHQKTSINVSNCVVLKEQDFSSTFLLEASDDKSEQQGAQKETDTCCILQNQRQQLLWPKQTAPNKIFN